MGFLDDVGFDERVVYPSIKKCHCSSLQNTLVATSCPASVSLFAELLNQSIVRPSSHFICHLFIQHISHHIKNLVVYLLWTNQSPYWDIAWSVVKLYRELLQTPPYLRLHLSQTVSKNSSKNVYLGVKFSSCNCNAFNHGDEIIPHRHGSSTLSFGLQWRH